MSDPAYEELAAQTRAIRASRVERAKAMIAKLNELGAEVSWEQVTRIAGGGVIGRPHIARAMIEAGVVGSSDEAFTPPWIGPGGRAHVGRYALDPAEAIRLVHAAGGGTVLAHPFAVTRGWVVPEDLISELALARLDGVEVAHPDHDPAQRGELLTVARKLRLVATGGSGDDGRPQRDAAQEAGLAGCGGRARRDRRVRGVRPADPRLPRRPAALSAGRRRPAAPARGARTADRQGRPG